MINDELKIGYALTMPTKLGYMGAILVTDEKGFPLEFQYTDPIAPTKLQKVLYGDSLEKYLKVDVILNNLLKVLSDKIDILIVKDEQVLCHNNSNIDIIRISETGFNIKEEDAKVEKVKDDEYIFRYSQTAMPVRVTFSRNVAQEDALFEKVYSIITQVGNSIDIIEPLERVQQSIEVIVSKDKE